MIKRITFVIGLAALLSAPLASARAQSLDPGYEGAVTITPVRLEQVGKLLHVDLDVTLSDVRMNSKLNMEFTPRLVSEEQSCDLPAISVRGRSNYKAYERSLTMEGRSVAVADLADPGLVVKGYGKSDTTWRYNYIMPYEPWMANAWVNLARTDSGCGESTLVGLSKLADSIRTERPPVNLWALAPPVLQLAYVMPAAETVKSREIQAECRLDFVVNKTEINPSYRNNPQELAKIRDIIEELKNDPSITIEGIEIVGYASPEGSYENNKRLSEGRATTLRDYLAALYDFPMNLYKVSFGGENWDGLVKALEQSSMSYADEAVAIIRNTPSDEARKNQLTRLRSGAPYRYMLENFYPALRTAFCKIDYRIKGFGTEDAMGVFRTRPQNLSLNELYLVANTMKQGSPEFIEVFETAVRLYPEDEVANLNAAAAALENGNVEVAERYLARISDIPQSHKGEYYNAVGILAWLQGQRDFAMHYLEEASAAGSPQAQNNLDTIHDRWK